MTNKLQAYVDDFVKNNNIPALSLAVWENGELDQAAAGILNVNTGVEATTDSIFQIGSISKVLTSCLIMQLVEQGRVELDKPVKQYLKDFTVGSAEATETITVRQLLTHTSGLAGDFFGEDLTGGAEPIARYVDRCHFLPQLHPVGEMFSYCNTGFVIAGRLAEVMTGCSWAELVEQRIFKPLGMTQSVVNPADTLKYRAAMGHLPAENDEATWEVASQCYFPMGLSPAGTVISMSSRDLITFGLAHLQRGQVVAKPEWLSEDSIHYMQQPQWNMPSHWPQFFTHWGLGWSLINSQEIKIFGHDGGTLGQCSMLRVVPEKNLVIAAFINSESFLLLRKLFSELMESLDVAEFKEAEEFTSINNLEKYCGTYESLGAYFDVINNNDQLVVENHQKNLDIPPERYWLKPLDSTTFAVFDKNDIRQFNTRFIFSEKEDKAQYLSWFLRLNKRLA